MWILKNNQKEIKTEIIINSTEEEEEEIEIYQTEVLDLYGNKDKYNKDNNNNKYIFLKTLQG